MALIKTNQLFQESLKAAETADLNNDFVDSLMEGVDQFCDQHTSYFSRPFRRICVDQLILGENEPWVAHLNWTSASHFIDNGGRLVDLETVTADPGTMPENLNPEILLNETNTHIEGPANEEIDWERSIFVPNTSYFILLGDTHGYVRSTANPQLDLCIIEDIDRCFLWHAGVFQWVAGGGRQTDLRLHKPCFLLLHASDGVRAVDLRPLFAELLPGAPIHVVYQPHIGDTEVSANEDKIVLLGNDMYMLNLHDTAAGRYKPITCCFKILTAGWPSINEKDKKLESITINKIDLPFDIDAPGREWKMTERSTS